jgi:GT2 family glycosyltransferase
VSVLESPFNRGWSGGNNLGIRYGLEGGADYIVLANNDIKVDRRWISGAVTVAESDPSTGIIGFHIIEPRKGDDDGGFTEAVRQWPGLEVVEGVPVNGMAMFTRAALFQQLGLIDEGFFAYAEDNDFEQRVRLADYRVATTNIPVWHHGRGTFGRIPLRAATLQIRNNLRLSLKHDPPMEIIYQLARHWAKACLPFIHIDPHDAIGRRLRPSNILVNFAIWLYAVLWNLWCLPGTLRSRQLDRQRALQARFQSR